MSRRTLRVRRLLDEQFDVAVAILVVLALVGGAVTYTTHVAPETTTEERVVATWQRSGVFEHSATVTQENSIFPVGEQLRNRTVYFSSIAPVLNGSYIFEYQATNGGELTTSIDVGLVTRSIAEGQGDEGETVFWETSRPLGETRTATVEPGGNTRVEFAFNASEVESERERIEEELGGTPGTTGTFVRAVVGLEGTVNGQAVDTQHVHTLPVTFEGDTYRVGPAEAGTNQFDTTETVTTAQTYGPLRSVGGPALVLLSVVGIVGLVVARSRDEFELTESEREWLAYRDDREEFDEWITSFTLPDETFDRPRAEASSLADLVDFAIDTDNGVVVLPNGSTYYVVHDDLLYTYTAPPTPGGGDSLRPGGEANAESDTDSDASAGTDEESDEDESPDRDADSTAASEAATDRLETASLDLGLDALGDEDDTSGTDAKTEEN
ncbi:DUF5305 family protein [Salinigranum halophilum]|uniref:DUF5305 family protein n=1 Tax=Salinigranum halophilum TaxID=2565931 RepID=UPI0010A77573|nr:DUF5305 family protein [Salinigranum halophilum]